MSDTNKALINKFYTAFQNHDAESMAACYHEEVAFSDPAFGELRGEEVSNMWRMLIHRSGGNLDLTFSDIEADEQNGSAKWEAKYLFSKTGRNVHNKITASFRFKDGKIIEHHDVFDFNKWAAMALGPMGRLLGFGGMLQNKVRKTALAQLKKYSDKRRYTDD